MKNHFLFISLFVAYLSYGQSPLPSNEIVELINQFKEDPRGPYLDIMWFCDDGTFVKPKEECPEKGVQRARYKEQVKELMLSNHIFLGQILSTTNKKDFWDDENNNSRLKQYQLEHYLHKIDNGWVNRRGQYYRGAFQIEDEIEWGTDFFRWVLRSDPHIEEHFYLLRQAAKDIPHGNDSNLYQLIRAESKILAESYPKFMDLRVKIHGQPDSRDVQSVKLFLDSHQENLTNQQRTIIDDLIAQMEQYYAPIEMKALDKYLKELSSSKEVSRILKDYMANFEKSEHADDKIRLTSETLLRIRENMTSVKSSKSRLALLDLSNDLESIYLKTIPEWKAKSTEEMANKIQSAGKAAAGTGYLELWEWETLSSSLAQLPSLINVEKIKEYLSNSRRIVEWGVGMTRATYDDVIGLYLPFESQAYGFNDDRIRASVLLDLGVVIGTLEENAIPADGNSNMLMGIPNASAARGLNSGFALGELVVMEKATEDMEVDKNKIYVFNRPPSDLKPVAGIATVTEGNLVSHVQLLARNLSVPNAIISDQNLKALRSFAGQRVFYAVSSAGQVIMKPESEMTPDQKALFTKKKRSQEKVAVPVDKINLDQTSVLNMRELNAASSGVICGPKAANLAQLKSMFPKNVVEGIVIPFGIFRKQMDQKMPGKEISYWTFLNNAFSEAEEKRKKLTAENEIESFLLQKLSTLRAAIEKMKFTSDFEKDLEQQFKKAFASSMGKVPVFLRSDTNMEDLENFTGAGLNLTLFNVVDKSEIKEGIKKVWASPYTERSFKWRQRYLLNPENVFPSILIIPSVDVDFSGVLITKGITSGNADDLTFAASKGAGGAVEGQEAESYLLRADGTTQLLTPAREPNYKRLPKTGGTSKNTAYFDKPVVDEAALNRIRDFAKTVESTFPKAADGSEVTAYDIELGFAKDKLWLFQIRPFVESKNDWENEDASIAGEMLDDGKANPERSFPSWLFYAVLIFILLAFSITAYLKRKS